MSRRKKNLKSIDASPPFWFLKLVRISSRGTRCDGQIIVRFLTDDRHELCVSHAAGRVNHHDGAGMKSLEGSVKKLDAVHAAVKK